MFSKLKDFKMLFSKRSGIVRQWGGLKHNNWYISFPINFSNNVHRNEHIECNAVSGGETSCTWYYCPGCLASHPLNFKLRLDHQ